MKKKYMKLVGLMMALGLSLGIAACGGGSTSSNVSETPSASSSVAESSSAAESSVEEQKVGNYTADSWGELVALSSFENCTVEGVMNGAEGSGLTESSKHLFAANGYSRTGTRNILGGVNGVDLTFATADAAVVETERAALLGFLEGISFDEITYNSTAKAYVASGEFYTANGKTYKDATLKVKNGKVDTVAVTIVTEDSTESHTLKFTKYGSTTPAAPQA
ncbi:MAG: hypothetical protein IKA40_05010 [Clostridia bacterium]|nr:hypothetical protein [Clostridia bacterium]